jgi:Fic family protein
LNNIAAARETILHAAILPQYEVKLQVEAMIERIFNSTSIEGNPLTKEEVRSVLQGKDVPARDKDKQEILNYRDMLEYVDTVGAKEKKITEKVVKKIHGLTVKDILDKKDCGAYRKVPVVVMDSRTGENHYRAPGADVVPHLMKDFVAWLQSNEIKDLNPVIIAAIAHYQFVKIHPFTDGNGRTGRALATLVLFMKGFDTKKFFALDDFYNDDRNKYYEALQKTDKAKDLTIWLDYFVEGVAVSMAKVKRVIKKFSLDRRLAKAKGQIFLDERQMKVLEHIEEHGRITSVEYGKMFKIDLRTAQRHLLKLKELGLIVAKGGSKNTYYVLS